MTYDVAVVGAGPAGIAAARALAGSELSVIVLEARDRVGGRAHTVEAGGYALDLGCGWLHSCDENPLSGLAEASGVELDHTPPPWDRQAFDHEFSSADQAAFREASAAFDERVAQMAALPEDPPANAAFEPDARWNPLINAISGYLNGAAFDAVSLKDYAAYRDTERNARAPTGYGALIAGLATGLDIRLGWPVERIDRTGDPIVLTGPGGSVEARSVIVTVPTDILTEGRLAFDPPLPDKGEAADGLPLGLANKVHFLLDGAGEFPPDSQLLGRTDRAETCAYHLRPFGRPMIELFGGGALAVALDAEGPGALEAFGREELARLLGSAFPKRLTTLTETRWKSDPWSRGAYSYARPGRQPARAELARPVEDRIFFAGEACSEAFFGTAHGAWIEGERAAREVMAALGQGG